MRRVPAVAAAGLAAATLIQATADESRVHQIEIKGVAFAPAQVTVRAGDTVEWANGDIVAHTAISKGKGPTSMSCPATKGAESWRGPGRSATPAATIPTWKAKSSWSRSSAMAFWTRSPRLHAGQGAPAPAPARPHRQRGPRR